ncbi:MAG: serine/threonine-protein kinase [Planctomycetota bacterium]
MEAGPQSPLSAGMKDGDFELETLLGRGGMGEVWRARQLSLQRSVALKFVAGMTGRQELRDRLDQEARSAARIAHPNAVKIFGVTEFLGRNAVIMEEVRGRTVRDRLKTGEGFSMERILSIALQTAKALAAAEREGVVHRDIKPGNLMLDDEGHLTVLDFGLARMLGDPSITRTGVILGTAQYMSPEQALGRTTDIRGDLYSLGIVLFELLAGFPPYRASHAASLAKAHVEEDVPVLTDSSIPGPLAGLVATLMDKDPAKRPQRASQAVKDIEMVRLACLTHPEFKSSHFHSRRLELEMLETATGQLAGWSPRKSWGRWAALGLVVLAGILSWNLAEPDDPVTPPLTIQPPYRPDPARIRARLEADLEAAFQSEVDRDWLENQFPSTPIPEELQSLRRQIERLSLARLALAGGDPAHAFTLLDTLPKDRLHPQTLKALELCRAYLLPDDEIKQSLSLVRNLIRKGSVEEARRELARLATLRPTSSVVADFERSLDEIVFLRRTVQGFLANGCFEEIPARLKSWAALAPDDPLMKAYGDRLELELSHRTPAILATREELEREEPSSDPWIFYLRLLAAESSAGPWIPPLLHRTEERLATKIAHDIVEASRGAGPASAGILDEHLDRLRDLAELGWQWTSFKVNPLSWKREGRSFLATFELKAEGSWPVDPTPRRLVKKLTLEVNLSENAPDGIPVSGLMWAP